MIFRRRSDRSAAVPPAPAVPGSPSRVPVRAVLLGPLAGVGDLVIEGRVAGDIDASGEVRVAAGALVEGAVRGRVVHVAGRVLGPVRGEERIEVVPGGSVEGDLTSPHVTLDDGAELHGKVDVLR